VHDLPTPCYLLETAKLKRNLELINAVQTAADCRILLALKGFAMWSVFPIINKYLSGCAASSYNEARLAKEHFGGHVHLYAPAFSESEFPSLLSLADRITFNSISQWQRLGNLALDKGISCGIRVNPGINEVETALYNPCDRHSRLGVGISEVQNGLPEGIDGIHVHALCENDVDSTERLIDAIENHFAHLLPGLKWVNLGGGHLMTRPGYDIDRLIEAIKGFSDRHPQLELILEPGSAIAWDTGPLISSVLDIVQRDELSIAILDTSASAHMPDLLEMPYRARVRNADFPSIKPYTYRLGGNTCLAGDIIGDYSFDRPLEVGDHIFFEDMNHYTMVKSTQFNGVRHPCIAIQNETGNIDIVRKFDYSDYESRLS
jgi:carboxynorspermidine decarboxylase